MKYLTYQYFYELKSYVLHTLLSGTKTEQEPLSQGGQCDTAVHFDTYWILQRHFLLVFVCRLQWINYLSKSDKY